MRERYPLKNPINDAIIRLENTLHNPLHDEMMVIYKLGLEDGKFDVLDSIRAEIDLYLFQNEFGAEYRKEVSQIIDKYISGKEN